MFKDVEFKEYGEELNGLMVTKAYLKKMNNDSNFPNFIKGKERENLIYDLENLEKTILNEENNPNYFHQLIQACQLVWKDLFTNAMAFIDSNSSGFKELIDYFDEFVKFEELLYSTDDFYRDHTTHVLWTYLLAEKILDDIEGVNLIERYISPLKGTDDFYLDFSEYLEQKGISEKYLKID